MEIINLGQWDCGIGVFIVLSCVTLCVCNGGYPDKVVAQSIFRPSYMRIQTNNRDYHQYYLMFSINAVLALDITVMRRNVKRLSHLCIIRYSRLLVLYYRGHH